MAILWKRIVIYICIRFQGDTVFQEKLIEHGAISMPTVYAYVTGYVHEYISQGFDMQTRICM